MILRVSHSNVTKKLLLAHILAQFVNYKFYRGFTFLSQPVDGDYDEKIDMKSQNFKLSDD